jgi:hypothetical protein
VSLCYFKHSEFLSSLFSKTLNTSYLSLVADLKLFFSKQILCFASSIGQCRCSCIVGSFFPFIVCITITSMDCCIGNAYLRIFLLHYICDIIIQVYWMPMVVGFSKGIQSVICSVFFEDTINWLIKKSCVVKGDKYCQYHRFWKSRCSVLRVAVLICLFRFESAYDCLLCS